MSIHEEEQQHRVPRYYPSCPCSPTNGVVDTAKPLFHAQRRLKNGVDTAPLRPLDFLLIPPGGQVIGFPLMPRRRHLGSGAPASSHIAATGLSQPTFGRCDPPIGPRTRRQQPSKLLLPRRLLQWCPTVDALLDLVLPRQTDSHDTTTTVSMLLVLARSRVR